MTTLGIILRHGKQFITLYLILAILVATDSHAHCPQGCTCTPNSRHALLSRLSCSHANVDDIRPSEHAHSVEYKSVFTSSLEAQFLPQEPNNLEHLSWTESGLKTVKEDAFQSIRGLVSLNLSDNEISGLNDALRHLDHLRTLNLTSNKLKRISYNEIPQFLEKLSLAHNLLHDDCFLRGEYKDGVCSESTRPRKNLSTLDISHNSLTEFHGFSHCENLVELDISHNEISSVSDIFLVNIFRLKRLDISHNRLAKLFQSMLKNAVSLEYLDISANRISDISETFFRNVESLKYLDLSDNPILVLPTLGFQNCHSLNTLVVDNTLLEFVPDELFYGLDGLMMISMKNNQFLGRISHNAFMYSPNLEYLDFRSNNLTGLPKSLNLLSRVKRIFLYGNPISCSCRPSWFGKWAGQYGVESDFNGTVCSEHFNVTSESVSCIEESVLPRLTFELGSDVMLDCGSTVGSNVTWTSPTGVDYKLSKSPSSWKTIQDAPLIQDAPRITILENGSLFVKHILREDCGLYVCHLSDQFFNKTNYFVVQLDPITYYRIKIQSIVAGMGSALGFLALTIIVQMIRKLCQRYVIRQNASPKCEIV